MNKQQLQEFLMNKPPYMNCGWLICKDGYHLSIQASNTLYSKPRKNYVVWSEVEVMPKTGKLPIKFSEYSSDGEVYGFVPTELVLNLINEHGGWIGEKNEP